MKDLKKGQNIIMKRIKIINKNRPQGLPQYLIKYNKTEEGKKEDNNIYVQ